MADTPESPRTRLALRKRDLQTAAAAELISLLETVTSDGRITEEEANMIRQWLEDRELSDMPGITYLRGVLETVLADGKVTDEERTEIYKAVEKILPPELRRGARERRQVADTAEKLKAREDRERAKQEKREEAERNRPIETFNFIVAGCTFHQRPVLVRNFARVQKPVELCREPTNPHSPKRTATLVVLDSIHRIGYVPEVDSQVLAPLLDQGCKYRAEISRILSNSRRTLPCVVVRVFRPDNTLPDLKTTRELLFEPDPPSAQRKSGCLGCGSAATATVIGVLGAIAWFMG